MHILLSGIVGSTAYGLAGPDSDIDRLGVFAAPTLALLGLNTLPESVVTSGPDRTLHEAAKWLRLALGCNPTVMALVWLPEELYEVRTELGHELITMRSSFLSAQRVRDAYLGYATQQFRRLEGRSDGSFSADTRKRTAKRARHLRRLCHQGFELYASGRVQIGVTDPADYHRFGERVASGDTEVARRMLPVFEDAFNDTTSPLPERPDQAAAERWFKRVRRAYYEATDRRMNWISKAKKLEEEPA
ncbi:nucleotidyltransferase domain-containing protein [Micromonospora sp. NPDC005652]|uniref:nucleotidyltransferase domain-containing protein n=1 Tax=Micromonospora sp. NPDC005652 TaxID=3157046 RepID=UPI0033F2AA6A